MICKVPWSPSRNPSLSHPSSQPGEYVCVCVCCDCTPYGMTVLCSGLGDDNGEIPEVAEMPVNLDIEVEAVPLDEHDIEHLRMDTRSVLSQSLYSELPSLSDTLKRGAPRIKSCPNVS